MDQFKEFLQSMLEDDSVLESFISKSKKRPAPELSPVKLKKIKTKKSLVDVPARSLHVVTEGGPKDGACIKPHAGEGTGQESQASSSAGSLHVVAGGEPKDGASLLEEEDGDDGSQNESFDLNELEAAYCPSEMEGEEGNAKEVDGSDADSEESLDLDVIGGSEKESWAPSKKVFEWFLHVADLEMKKEDLDKIKKDFKASEELTSHFEPPRLPSSVWNSINSSANHNESTRLKTIFKAQEYICHAMKPLLSSLSLLPKESRSNLSTAIQLLCNANLTLNRYRRAVVTPHIKKDLRKQILSLPVSHNSFFGENFEKSADSVLKEQNTLSKIFIAPRGNLKKSVGPWKNKAHQNSGNDSASFRGKTASRGRGRGFRRGRGRGVATSPATSGGGSGSAGTSAQ